MACRVEDKTNNDVLELLVAGALEGMAEAMSNSSPGVKDRELHGIKFFVSDAYDGRT